MSKTISTRIDDEDAEKLEKIAKKENIDRSALVRKFILQKLKEYDIKQMTELYQKGIVSLQEAASQANVSLYEIMEYVQREYYSVFHSVVALLYFAFFLLRYLIPTQL